jgi:serine/threonine-protein kinase HipA
MVFNVLVSNVDDHLRNHGFLWVGRGGWTLSPAYDLNPTPIDVRQRILTTNINLDEGTCDIDLVVSVAEYFGLASIAAKEIIKEVATATATWRELAATVEARPSEIRRMESAFEHGDLTKALAMGA